MAVMNAATSDNPPSAAPGPHRFRPVLGALSIIRRITAEYRDAGRISPRCSGPVNEDVAEVVDVGEGRPGGEQIAEPREERGGIVLGNKGGRIEAERAGPRGGGPVDKSPGRVVGAPGAAGGPVGVAGKRRDALRAVERQRQRERVFLVGAAAAVAADRDGQFAAGKKHGAPVRRGEFAALLRVRGGTLARLALEPVAEKDAFVAGRFKGEAREA